MAPLLACPCAMPRASGRAGTLRHGNPRDQDSPGSAADEQGPATLRQGPQLPPRQLPAVEAAGPPAAADVLGGPWAGDPRPVRASR